MVQAGRNVAAVLPTPREMIAHLDRHVIGQDEAKRSVAVAVYRHYVGARYGELDGARHRDLGRQHVLLLGPTGTGKTLLVRTLAEFLGVPFSYASATAFSETGYVGEKVESLVTNLLAATGGDVARAQRGIVFLDEVDKIRRGETGGRDVSGEGVQAGLLTLLDGSEVSLRAGPHTVRLDVGKVLFVCTGAFVGLSGIVRRRLQSGEGVGFRAAGRAAREPGEDELLQCAETADLEAFGLIPELVGRFTTITALRGLGRGELVRILRDAEGSALDKQRTLFALHGIDLAFEDGALEALADEATRLGTGARGLRRALARFLTPFDVQLPELRTSGVRRIVVTREFVLGLGEPRLEVEPAPGGEPSAAERLRRGALGPAAKPGAKEQPPQGAPVSDAQVLASFRELERQHLRVEQATPAARAWWADLVRRYEDNPRVLLRIAQGLRLRGATVEEYHAASSSSRARNLMANLHYVDFLRALRSGDPPEVPGPRGRIEDLFGGALEDEPGGDMPF